MIPKRKDRDMALARALKFAPLFQEGTFERILEILAKPEDDSRKTAFNAELDAAGIKAQEDKNWLYHYLQHMRDEDDKYWKEAKEAAYTGW